MIISKQHVNVFTISMTQKEFITYHSIISLIRYQIEEDSQNIIIETEKLDTKIFLDKIREYDDIMRIFSEDKANYDEIARDYDERALYDYTDDAIAIIENLFKDDSDYEIFIANFLHVDNFLIRLSI